MTDDEDVDLIYKIKQEYKTSYPIVIYRLTERIERQKEDIKLLKQTIRNHEEDL